MYNVAIIVTLFMIEIAQPAHALFC